MGNPKKKNKKPSERAGIDPAYLGVYLDETEQNIEQFNEGLVALEKNPADTGLINNLLRIAHTIKGSSGMMNITDVQDLAHAIESVLAIARAGAGALPEMFPLLFSGIDTVTHLVSSLRRKEAATADIAPVVRQLKDYVEHSAAQETTARKRERPAPTAESHDEAGEGKTTEASIRIDAHKLDNLMNLSGELVAVRVQYERLVNLLQAEILSERELLRVIAGLKSSFVALNRDLGNWIRKKEDPQTKHILRQLEFVGGYVRKLDWDTSQSKLGTEIRLLDQTTGALGKISSYIQAAVMQARMVPIKGVFSRFNRIVRDIAKELGKDAVLVLEGEETELDKNLIDGLGEPLTHMVRNAVDHGIEDALARQKAGKPGSGTITLRAFHEGNHICIEVEDDGRGLDPELLVRNAVQKKLIAQEQVQRLTDREKLNLMFLPGFSTAARVTGLSGRGVGMGAVRNMIAAMNGTVDIHSQLGKKTTFTLKIPLTLAIIQSLLIVVGGEIYAVPLEAVVEIMEVNEEAIDRLNGRATVFWREQAVRVVELQDVIHILWASRQDEDTKRVVIISDGNSQTGILVDRFIGQAEIVIKALSRHFAHVRGISGVTILGDGEVALILDPKILLTQVR